jgi:pimeloyl-ACP methyl ester carboxylesterase
VDGPWSRVVVTDDVSLHALTWEPATPDPDRAPFLLVHGLASNAQLWVGLGELLAAAGHRVVAVDQRGHGLSGKVDDGYDFGSLTADLVAVAAAFDLDRPVAVGQSWGGNVVLELAARHGDRLRGVVCVDGGLIELSGAFPDWTAARTALTPPPLAGMPLIEVETAMRRDWLRDWPETGIRGQLGNFAHYADGSVAPHLTLARHLTILQHLWEHHPTTRLDQVTVPVLLLPVRGGGHGDLQAAAIADAQARLASVRTHWFEGHHDVHAEDPDAVAAVLFAALDDGFFED